MIRSLRLSILSILAVALAAAAEAPAQSAAKTSQKSPRFSAEAIDLLGVVSQGYDLNGMRYSSRTTIDAVLPFMNSKDPDIREIAEMSRNLIVLHTLHRKQGSVIQKAFQEQAAKWPAIFAGQLIKSLTRDGSDTSDIRKSAKLLEKLMGTKPQKVVNEGWRIAYLGNGLSLATADKIRDLARRQKLASPAPLNAIDVRLETAPNRLGLINFSNRSGQTLHNCLVITRLNVDRDLIRTRAAQEDLVGKLVLPLLGFSKPTILGSREAARLRNLFAEQDKGGMLYIAAFPPGATVTTSMTRPDFYLFSKSACVSIWSDEIAVEQQQAVNWAEARAAVQKTRKVARKKR